MDNNCWLHNGKPAIGKVYEEFVIALPDRAKYEEFLTALPDVDYWDIFDPSLEFFADSFSANLTQYNGSLESLERHLPSATAAFRDIMENALQEGTK